MAVPLAIDIGASFALATPLKHNQSSPRRLHGSRNLQHKKKEPPRRLRGLTLNPNSGGVWVAGVGGTQQDDDLPQTLHVVGVVVLRPETP